VTAPTTSRQFIRYVWADDVRRVYGRHGARQPGLIINNLTVDQVRALAQEERQRGDNLYPTRPENVAKDLERLAAETEARQLLHGDSPVYSDAELALLREAEKRSRDRSPLLHDFAKDLECLAGNWRCISHMQSAAAVLDDVDLLVPGIAVRLRPLVALPEIGGEE